MDNAIGSVDLLCNNTAPRKARDGFEFLMFKQQDGKIDGADFARSIIKYVESSKKRKYINRVKQFRE